MTKRRHPLLTPTLLLSTTIIHPSSSECNYCTGKNSGYIQVPGTSCRSYVQCANGAIGQSFDCGAGLIFDPALSQCNWESGVTCGPDYDCPSEAPVVGPTDGPTEEPTIEPNYEPTPSPVRGRLPPGVSNAGSGSGGGYSSNNYGPTTPHQQSTINKSQPMGPNTPYKHEQHAAIFAHLNANKISLYNNIFSRSKRLYPNNNEEAIRQYYYSDFIKSLRTMSEIGYTVPLLDSDDNDISYINTFYLGDPTSPDGAGAGLINISLFLSSALGDSLAYGSCDEINRDEYNGILAQSNSCGQWGQSYQDMHCEMDEAHMECPLTYGMRLEAESNVMGVQPFFCAGTEEYRFTGVASGGNYEVVEDDSPVQNREGRTDVENCCWWGRGIIHTKGVCQFGKLNYYIGARAKEEGRDALLPEIDFCQMPQMICSRENADVEWITGMWRWVDGVQSYDRGGWNYIRQLNQFVMDGMKDVRFVEAVSGIVTQGCHAPPCEGSMGTAVEVVDVKERWENFQLVAQTLGLPVKSVQL